MLDDSGYMRIALELARNGEGHVSPNPMVGAVIVKDGRIIGKGWHERFGEAHAEINALRSATEPVRGATMFVTLEPCCHHGHQPPCTDALISSGIARVVAASSDPNPLVSGKGFRMLREHGIAVTEGVLRDEADRLNEIFLHYISGRHPFIALKHAMSLDGKIAAYTGMSRWITGEEARTHAHRLRNCYSALMAGIGTVLADDPLLTCRIPGGRNPVRIILDTHLRIPLSSRIAATAGSVPTIIVTCSSDREARKRFEDSGCRVLEAESGSDGRIALSPLMKRLGDEGIDSILVEGGGTVAWSLLAEGLVNKVYGYIAPKIIGGRDALTPVEGEGVRSPDEAFVLRHMEMRMLGPDLLIEGDL